MGCEEALGTTRCQTPARGCSRGGGKAARRVVGHVPPPVGVRLGLAHGAWTVPSMAGEGVAKLSPMWHEIPARRVTAMP